MKDGKISKVALVGLGAVGAVVASELQTVPGLELYCVVDEERKARYGANGIFINGKRQDCNAR